MSSSFPIGCATKLALNRHTPINHGPQIRAVRTHFSSTSVTNHRVRGACGHSSSDRLSMHDASILTAVAPQADRPSPFRKVQRSGSSFHDGLLPPKKNYATEVFTRCSRHHGLPCTISHDISRMPRAITRKAVVSDEFSHPSPGDSPPNACPSIHHSSHHGGRFGRSIPRCASSSHPRDLGLCQELVARDHTLPANSGGVWRIIIR